MERAATAYRKAFELKPDYTAVYNGLSNALRILGQTDELGQVLDQGISIPTKTGDHTPTQRMRVRLNRLKKRAVFSLRDGILS